MDTDPDKDNTGMPSTSDVLSFICFIATAYYVLKLSKPSHDAPMPGTSPGRRHMGRQGILRTTEASSGDQSENAGTERESSEEDGYEVRLNERKESFGIEEGKTDDIFLSESEESGARDLSEEGEKEEEEGADENKDEDEDKDEDDEDEDKEEEKEKPEYEPSKRRSRTWTAYNAPTSKPPRKPTPGLLNYDTDHYRPYDATTQNQGAAVLEAFRHFRQYDDYALYINPNLKDTELDQIPHSGVRVDDLTASKVLSHYNCKTLRTRWPAEFDQKGMIRATRVPLGRAAKRWVDPGERDVDGKLAEEEGWYYLSWGGIHTLMGKEGLDVDRYWIRPSHGSFKCPGLGFNRSDWAEVQLAPEDPADPTFL